MFRFKGTFLLEIRIYKVTYWNFFLKKKAM